MKDILVIHHSADFDGICSREVARKHLGDTADYLGWDYGNPLPDLSPYIVVYLIDISLPAAIMAKHADRLIWIDHHISKIREMDGASIRGYRIDGVAACRLAWQWFNASRIWSQNDSSGVTSLPSKQDYVDRKVDEPYAVQLLGEYDIWDKRNPEVDYFQLGLLAEKIPQWESIFTMGRLSRDDQGRIIAGPVPLFYVESVINAGRTIHAFTEVTNAQISQERGFDVEFEGLKLRALNIARCNSMTFTAAIKPNHEGCLAYYWNGSKWRFSLYHVDHRKDIDLSKIAAKYGGGGHRGACGFELQTLPKELGGSTH